METAKNVLGTTLETCSLNPLTGAFRDGCCNTDIRDIGTHTVCAIMTSAFLAYTKSVGNDLETPRPEYQFQGLKPGDKWCLCVSRWKQAYQAGVAPQVVLNACHQKCLDYVSFESLLEHKA